MKPSVSLRFADLDLHACDEKVVLHTAVEAQSGAVDE